jgi:hypothetical protein
MNKNTHYLLGKPNKKNLNSSTSHLNRWCGAGAVFLQWEKVMHMLGIVYSCLLGILFLKHISFFSEQSVCAPLQLIQLSGRYQWSYFLLSLSSSEGLTFMSSFVFKRSTSLIYLTGNLYGTPHARRKEKNCSEVRTKQEPRPKVSVEWLCLKPCSQCLLCIPYLANSVSDRECCN